MRYYELIERSNLGPTPFVADVWDLKGQSPKVFECGRAILDWPQSVSFTSSSTETDGELTDFVVNNAMVPLVTTRFLNFLTVLRVPPFQDLPADALYSTGKRVSCSIINFLSLIHGFDETKSDFVVYPDDWETPALRGEVWIVNKVVLRKKAIQSWDFFRCARYTSLFASEKFMEHFKKSKLRGVSFSEVEVK